MHPSPRPPHPPASAPRPPGRWPAAGPLLAAAAALALAVSAPAPAAGQAGGDNAPDPAAEGTAWFPDSTAFRPLLAAPRETDLRGSLVVADRRAPAGEDFAGANLEAEVVLGHRIGVVRLQREGPERPAITLGFEAAVFNRFALETSEKDLIGSDYRVGVPLSLRAGPWSGRFVLLHVSSHLGDDFIARFGPPEPRRQVTRDGFELTLARRLPAGLRLYGGADLNFHANPSVERVAGRWGVEWDPAPGGDGEGASAADGARLWPFAAVDAEVTPETRGPSVTGAAGLGIRVREMTLRLEARGHVGPSFLGQLDGRHEDFLGVGLRLDPL